MGQYLTVTPTGARPDIPEQVNISGNRAKHPVHANLTDEANISLEAAVDAAGISKSAFLEAVALMAGDILEGDAENPIIRTARTIGVRRVARSGRTPPPHPVTGPVPGHHVAGSG